MGARRLKRRRVRRGRCAWRRVAALAVVVLASGCGGAGSGGSDEPEATRDDRAQGQIPRRHASPDDSSDAPARLRKLVDDVVELAQTAPCSSFASALDNWGEANLREIAKLIEAITPSANDTAAREVAAELDAYVQTRRLAVLEAAADCAGNGEDEAWAAWERFEEAVDSFGGNSADAGDF